MKRRNRLIALATVCVAAAALAAAALAEIRKPAASEQAASGIVQGADAFRPLEPGIRLPPGKLKDPVAENERLRLFVHPETAAPRIVDKRTGREWNGAPVMTDPSMPPNNVKYTRTPIVITYTEGVTPSETYPLKEKDMSQQFVSIPNGLRVEYGLPQLGVSLAVEYRLTASGVDAGIPFASVREEGKARILSVQLLPFLEAAAPEENGALLIPDGAGALIRFKKEREDTFSFYSDYIYGPDRTLLNKVNESLLSSFDRKRGPYTKSIALPVFGLYREGRGMLGIVKEGDANAKITATPAGVRRIPYYRIAAEFIYRDSDEVFISKRKVPLVNTHLIEGDRSVRYVLLQDEEAGIAGMASAYRDYLVREKGLRPVGMTGMPLQIRLFGGLVKRDVFSGTFIAATTYRQAKSIIDAYAEKGVTSLELVYEAWSDGGLYGSQPVHKPESALGGRKRLEELADYAKRKGVSLYLQANYVRVKAAESSVSKDRDAVRGLNREVLEDADYWLEDRFAIFFDPYYLLKPNRAYAGYLEKELGRFGEWGIAGLSLEHMGSLLYSNQQEGNYMSRDFAARVWAAALSRTREALGSARVGYGNAYTFGSVDRIDAAPMDSSHYVYADDTVPFYQMVMHGLIPYTSEPINLADDPRREWLKALEYGAIPSFYLTHEPTGRLSAVRGNALFTGDRRTWLEPTARMHAEAAAFLEPVKNERIVGYEALAPDVHRTTYSNGWQITVNRGQVPYLADGREIPPMDYMVTQGR